MVVGSAIVDKTKAFKAVAACYIVCIGMASLNLGRKVGLLSFLALSSR